ncbi:D-proline reductase (dithiol) proprotein PrdA [Loigolactobacillus backii]|uniref:D-proline reductase (dithiol) proprotein PrdA n=1 Tax=Loigolactobacillus backii TaxID=375175 RepID=UPI0022FD9E31|nr:D-proline reductase (dithiol) proprotein PrdA [Loigolactobacillus backii]MDA5386833.1 D-proline reductase (dithiol) proprotein PrdA [Loigolactobacillus backii]MDA5389382.1 D-proline reductase (dithiol) proprotein PrdA [Loigolactobacillus backii]
MSITVEMAKEHADDPAVLCCRREGGKVLEAADFEDPTLFDDYVDSGLLTIPENALKLGQAVGAKLSKTTDALIPLTPDNTEDIQEMTADKSDEADATADDAGEVEQTAQTASVTPAVQPTAASNDQSQMLKLSISEGKGIDLQIPLSLMQAQGANTSKATNAGAASTTGPAATDDADEVPAKVVRKLTKKHFKIDKVVFGDETKVDGTTLQLRNEKQLCADAVETEDLVKDMDIEIITPDKYHEYSDTIMDVQPIATKESGDLGSGVTRVLDGVVMVLTGTDENGVQIGEFGSSEGPLDENIMWGRPGAVDKGDIMIKVRMTIEAGTNRERRGPLAAHKATDIITEEIRESLKKADDNLVTMAEDLVQKRHPKQKRVLIVKEIMGQGAMHDNLLMPVEPVGTLGAKPNVDLGNLPVVLAPTELLDGGIHALTCIGPASKETSRHYWREPLVEEAMKDDDIDLVGVALVGSPQENTQKFYVSKRLGMMVEAMNLDGAIVTTEGFGNNHIDFASHLEEIGKRGVSVVGVTYSAVQGQLVIGNKFMDAMVDNNKSRQGIENEVLSNNTLCEEDAIRALSMLQTKMAGGSIKKAEHHWNPNVKQNNVEAIEKQTGRTVKLVKNEQSLPMSKKRRDIYEKDED